METRICIKCGKELSVSEFHKDARMRSGIKSICKACISAESKARRVKQKEEKADTPLSKFTPRELIEELRKRGYKGKLQYVYEVVI